MSRNQGKNGFASDVRGIVLSLVDVPHARLVGYILSNQGQGETMLVPIGVCNRLLLSVVTLYFLFAFISLGVHYRMKPPDAMPNMPDFQ